MALQPQGNQAAPPIFRIPDEMLLHFQDFLENPRDSARLAATCRHMWSRLGANDGIHVREARFFERRNHQNQKAVDLEKKRASDHQRNVRMLRSSGWGYERDEAERLEKEDADFRYRQMRLVHRDIMARPPTLLLAIANGCPVELVGRIIDVYRREMPGQGYLHGFWGRGSWAGYSVTHTAVKADRTDVLQLLETQHLLTDHAEYSGVTERHDAPYSDLSTRTPIQAAIAGWWDNAGDWLVRNGHAPVDDGMMVYAAQHGGSSMTRFLVTVYRERYPDNISTMLDTCYRDALEQDHDRRGVMDVFEQEGADMTEDNGPVRNQLLPFAVIMGSVVNASHLLGKLVHRNMVSKTTLIYAVSIAPLHFPAHEFLPALITYAYLLAPDGTYDRTLAQQAGLYMLLRYEVSQARPNVDAARRTAGVGMLLDAGLKLSAIHYAIGPGPTEAEALLLIHYLAGRGCPVERPRRLRDPDATGSDMVSHPLRWLTEVAGMQTAAMCLVTLGARFADPGEHQWVRDAVERMFHSVFNNNVPGYQAERDDMIARCQTGRFAMDETIFDIFGPDPVTYCQQVLTLYLCVYEPPTRTGQPNPVLVRGAFIIRARDVWPKRLFNVDYYREAQ